MNNSILAPVAILLLLFITSCSLPKETLLRVEKSEKNAIDFPLDYANSFPTPTFEQWDKDYNTFDRFLTKKIMKTQMGMSYIVDSVRIWWCMPSARVHSQLDTTTMINNAHKIVGDWRTVCSRRVSYKDSAAYSDSIIYRDSELISKNEDDIVLVITNDKFKLFNKKKGNKKFKIAVSRNWHIENRRYLMLYKSSLVTSAISFIGIDEEGRLILNSYYVQERKRPNKYIVYQATMTQSIFEKIK
ncbi:MAG: hypothetical protein HOK72_02615 [Flavobacteriales bacterium]|jgi:hypothetical protein|nr:hypothetical protein [Flavobacteriales bacterium]